MPVMTKDEIREVKKIAGIAPFESRLKDLQDLGKEYRAYCPWHEKPGTSSPSLAVYPGDDGTWQFKCMSRDCGHGDVIAFVMKMDNLTFTDALRKLSNDSGMATPEKPTNLGTPTAEQLEQTRAYLADYGVSMEVAKAHGMDAVLHPKLGLAVSMPYDSDSSVIKYRCVGKPKDKNSKFAHASGHPSETLLYNITQTEKGIDNAWAGADVYVVESERDCLMMVSQGLLAVSVSSASTCVDSDGQLKIEDDQLKILARADNIYLTLDQDPAGQKCADAFEVNTNFNSVQVKRILWPYGGKRSEDPKDIGDLYRADPAAFMAKLEALATEARNRPPKWRQQFRTLAELDDQDVIQLIEGFLTEGNIGIGGLSGAGKTFMALSITKALTTGQPFVGRFPVREKVPVLYLSPEVGDRQFLKRAKAFGIPWDDDSIFMVRTLSQGPTLPLDHPDVLTAVRNLHKPVVILDTLRRFSKSADENNAAANQWMEAATRQLREAGCIAVIALHHSPKTTEDYAPTLENTFSGTTDIGALLDIAYSIRTNRELKESGEGEQITVRCVKARDLEDSPRPFNLGLKYKAEGETELRSFINERGDMVVMEATEHIAAHKNDARSRERNAANKRDEAKFLALVEAEPTISKRTLQGEMKVGRKRVTQVAERLGYEQIHDVWMPPPAVKVRLASQEAVDIPDLVNAGN
jgi:hypothetical protein